MNMLETELPNTGYDIGDTQEFEQQPPSAEPFDDTLVKLNDDEQQALAKELGEQLTKAYDSGSGYRDDIATWRAQYEGDLDEKPEKWQANYNLPHISSVIDTIGDQLAGLVCSGVPFFSCEPLKIEDDAAANTMEQMMEYWLRRMHFHASVRLGIHDVLLSGTNWVVDWAERNHNPSENYSEIATRESIEAYPFQEWISPEDIILIPFHAQSFKRAKGGFVRNVKRWSEILAAKDDKRFYPEGVEKIKANWSQQRAQTYQEQAQGIELAEPIDLWTAEFETWWGIYRWVKPGEKKEREYMVDVAWSTEHQSAIILRVVEYDSERFGGWPFTVIANRPRKNTMWGRSSVKPISGMQKWINATFDQMTDAVTMTILPPMAIRPGAGRRKFSWGPAVQNQVSNPATDIVSMAPPNTALAGIGAALNMANYVQNMTDRQTGTTEPTMGVQSQERRTAFEMGLVAQGGNVRFESQVAYLELGVGEDSGLETFAYKMAAILGAFMPRKPFEFPSTTGTQGMMTANPDVYDLKYRFTLRANSAMSNPDMRLKKAMASIQQIQQCPLTNPSVLDSEERLIEKMRAIWQAYREVWQIMGNKNPEEVIGAEPKTVEEAVAIAAAIPGAMPVAQVLAVRFGIIHPPTGQVDEKGQPIQSPIPASSGGEGNIAGLGGAGAPIEPGGNAAF